MKRLLVAALFASSAFVSGGVASGHPCYWDPSEPFHPAPTPDCGLFGARAADCGFEPRQQTTTVGGPVTGDAYGYVRSETPGTAVTVRCYVVVDGSEVATTPTRSGNTVAVTAGEVTYTESANLDVDLCAEWTIGGGSPQTRCDEIPSQFPPQEVIDVLDIVFDLLADSGPGIDPLFCRALNTAGTPAAVNVFAPTLSMDADDCDLYVEGERFIDFIPYSD